MRMPAFGGVFRTACDRAVRATRCEAHRHLPPLRPLPQDHRRQHRHRDHQSELHMVPIVGDWNAAGRIRRRRYNLVIRE